MTNIIGQDGSDALFNSVRFLYKLRTNFNDSGPAAIAAATPTGVGGIRPSFDLFPRFGAYAAPSGHPDHLQLPAGAVPDVGSGNWTVELFVWSNGWEVLSSITLGVFEAGVSGATPAQMSLGATGNGEFMTLKLVADDGTVTNGTGFITLLNGTAHHFAACRNGNNVYAYVDGVLQFTLNVAGKAFDFDGLARLFAFDLETMGLPNGHGADLRWTSAARYDGTKFSPPTLPFYDGTLDDSEVLEVRAWTFDFDGHSFYVLELGETGTFVYDQTTEEWAEFKTAGYNVWNARRGVFWNGCTVVADRAAPIIRKLDPSAIKDQGNLDITRIVTGIIPVRGRSASRCNAVRLTASVGAPTATTPTVSLRWSDDNGRTWSTPRSITLVAADYDQEIAWRALGALRAPGRVFEITDVGGFVRIDDADIEVA